MVELVRHSLVDSTVNLNVDIVADFIGPQVGGQIDSSLLPEPPLEQISRPRPQSVTGRHG